MADVHAVPKATTGYRDKMQGGDSKSDYRHIQYLSGGRRDGTFEHGFCSDKPPYEFSWIIRVEKLEARK